MHLSRPLRRSPAPRKRPTGHLHDLRPALPRRRIAARLPTTATRRRRLEELGLEGARVEGAADPRRHRRRRARSQPRGGPRGHHRQADRLALQAGAPWPGMAEDQERPAPGVRDRRLHRGHGPAQRTRSARCWSATTRDGELRYAGKVGTGYSDADLAMLTKRLKPLIRKRSPFAARHAAEGRDLREARAGVRVLVRRVDAQGLLRQPSFLGLREDKPAADVVRERGVGVTRLAALVKAGEPRGEGSGGGRGRRPRAGALEPGQGALPQGRASPRAT